VTRRPVARRVLVLALTLATTACARQPQGADAPPPAPLDLAGQRIMLMPARAGEPRELDAELLFWLSDRSPGTDWITPAEIRETVASIPSRFSLDAPRRIIQAKGEAPRLADPLYGDVRRLAAVLDVQLALVPLGIRVGRDSTGVIVELAAALASIHGGRVLWIHTVRSGPSESVSAGVAGAAETLARTLIRGDG